MTALRIDEHRTKGRADRAALFLSALAATSLWLSAGIIVEGDSERIAALPSFTLLAILTIALPAIAWVSKLRLEQAWPLSISLVLWLPFLGWSSVWDGPIEGIIWSLVVVGLIAARPPSLPRAFTDPRTAPLMATMLMALASAVVFGQVRNVIPGGDEPHYLAATQSILHDGDLKVANNYEKGEYLDYFPGRLEPHFLTRSKGGEIYSIHAPGVSVIVLPAFAVAGYSGAVWTIILVAALTCAIMWRLAFMMSASAAASWVGVAAVGLSAPYFFHTFTIYPEIIGGLCVLLGVWLLVEFAAGRDPEPRFLLAVGGALAVLPWLHTRFAVLAGIIGILILARLAQRPMAIPKIGAFLAAPVALGLGWFTFFYVIWGSPNPTVAYGADTSTSLSYVPRGVIGLLFDQQFGVLTTAPVYVMAVVGAFFLFKTQPRLTIELSLVVVPYVLIVASYAMWWGGAAAPGRFLVSVLPLAALPIAIGWAQSRLLRSVTLILIVTSAALIVPRAFEDNGRFIFNNRSGVDATLQWLSANYNLAAVMPSVHGGGGSEALRDAFGWLVHVALAGVIAGAIAGRRTASALFALTSLLLASAVVLMTRNSHAQPDRQLVMLERLRPSWHSTLIELPTRNRLGLEDLWSRLQVTVSGSSALSRVPAGAYSVVAAPGASGGSVKLFLGRNDAPIAEPSLDDLRITQPPFTLRLPVMARTLNFRFETAPGENAAVELRPMSVVSAAPRQPAIRAARFGQARAFFFDEWAYPERDGFWTRADGSATVVIDSESGAHQSGLPISVTAGQEPTTIHLSVGSWQESLTLKAGEKHDVVLPPPTAGSWTVHIRSGAGFRPSEREPGNRDVRKLAAWIAIR